MLSTNWGVEDPAQAKGTDAEIDAAFRTAYDILRTRIEAFLALPLTQLLDDPVQLKQKLDQIGQLCS